MPKYTVSYKKIAHKDLPHVGGKNASLGEMIKSLTKKGVAVPGGFAVTTDSYWAFLKENDIEKELKEILKKYNRNSTKSLRETGKKARQAIMKGKFPTKVEKEIRKSYREMCEEYGTKNVSVAVRSSAVCEDAPDASFAGQFETFLNIKGEEQVLNYVKECIASSFNDRVIAYREEKKVPHLKFALSVGIQKMVRSDLASSGIMFTLDTESGFRNVVLINSIFGIGEMIVQGSVTPDEFYVFKSTLEKGYPAIIRKDLGRKNKEFVYKKGGGLLERAVPEKRALKFSINDKEILTLAKWAVIIEKHYKRPQDIEWAKDGETGELFIVQARPETIHAAKKENKYLEYDIKTKEEPIVTGIAVGEKVGKGKVKVIEDVQEIERFEKGDVLVTKMTDPDWVSIMRLASAIITDEGGKTAHASIVGRELGVPTIVGTENGTKILKDKMMVTVDCTQGLHGKVYKGDVPYTVKEYDLDKIPKIKTKIMLNVGTPEMAFRASHLPSRGVGLARVEFVLAEKIRIHPLALYHYEKIKDRKIKEKIKEITIEHKDKKEHFVKELAEGIAQIAAAFYPREVIVRLSDFKTNEYRNLIGGELYEKEESNPMIGFRGASRYLNEEFFPAFQMECMAIKRVIEVFGLDNISLMVPFCRSIEEGKEIKKRIKNEGIKKTKIYVMAEIPSNVILAEKFSRIFDGFSIGSNDLAQLILGVDRDNALLSKKYDENNPAIRKTISDFLKEARKLKEKVGICGEAPAIIPGFVEFLVRSKIDYVSVNPDSFVQTAKKVHKAEKNKNV
jgi:pyruvate, water dikinase